MDESGEYPIDTEHLVKGSVVSADTIERAYGVKRGTDAYGLRVMDIVDYVSKRFQDRGEIVTVIQRKHDVVVLTDDEQVEYNIRSRQSGARRIARSHARALGADRSQISGQRLDRHDRANEVWGRRLMAMRAERAKPALKPAPRSTPGIRNGKADD